jgi:hypothetical protein
MQRIARLALIAISVISIVSGVVQLLAPNTVLLAVGGSPEAAASHFFAIIGMFMVLFGGLLWQSLRAEPVVIVPIVWAALQKLGAAAAVGLAVQRGLMAPIALVVAAFDLLSGSLALWYWNRVRRPNAGAAR